MPSVEHAVMRASVLLACSLSSWSLPVEDTTTPLTPGTLTDRSEVRELLTSTSSDSALALRIHEIKRHSTTGGMQENEYFHVMRYVRDNAPQRLLVWGLGYDSVTYDALNTGGVTTFLEFDVSWVGKADAATRRLNYFSYNDKELETTAGTANEFIAHPHRADKIGLLADRPCFDTIIIDSPLGLKPTDTGRAVPIYTASSDIRRCIAAERYPKAANVSVFVHDNNRASEDILTKAFLGTPVNHAPTSSRTGPEAARPCWGEPLR